MPCCAVCVYLFSRNRRQRQSELWNPRQFRQQRMWATRECECIKGSDREMERWKDGCLYRACLSTFFLKFDYRFCDFNDTHVFLTLVFRRPTGSPRSMMASGFPKLQLPQAKLPSASSTECDLGRPVGPSGGYRRIGRSHSTQVLSKLYERALVRCSSPTVRRGEHSSRRSVAVAAARDSDDLVSNPFPEKTARLVLEDGSVWSGCAFGATGTALGEVVFNTSMSGYQEIVTDPSYYGQLVAFTCTHIGNVGVNTGCYWCLKLCVRPLSFFFFSFEPICVCVV